jgi:hypothetical protein
MNRVFVFILILVVNVAQAKDDKVVQKVAGSEIKMLETDTCWAIIRKMKIPAAQPNYWAFQTTWYPNSKGQMININCYSAGDFGYHGPSYVEIVPAKLIKDVVAGREKDRASYFKKQDAAAKASGVL